MSKKQDNWICVHCGMTTKKRIVKPCPNREDNRLHFWIRCSKVSKACCAKLRDFSGSMDAEYMYYVAECYENEQQIETAMLWYQKSAELGYTKSMSALARIFSNGDDKAKDIAQSIFWYKKSADAGDVSAGVILGVIYETGDGVPQNIEEAELWYRKASSDSKLGKLGLMRIYELKREKTKMLDIYKELANTEPPAFSGGGFNGFMFWDYYISDVMSQTNEHDKYDLARRGYAFEHGIAGVEKNLEKAIDWYQKAADAGDSYSAFALGNIYSREESKNEKKAFFYFHRAAIAGCRNWYEMRGKDTVAQSVYGYVKKLLEIEDS